MRQPLWSIAPVNAAFDALPAGMVETLPMPENKEMLQRSLWFHDQSGNAARVTIADVRQSNGVIHVVDTVLLPR